MLCLGCREKKLAPKKTTATKVKTPKEKKPKTPKEKKPKAPKASAKKEKK